MKQLTLLVTLDEDTDVYDDVTQEGICRAVETTEAVKSAQVIGVGDASDPEPTEG